jgi:uncharacterized protein YdhG (YjbR/CyaY superfamily)
MDDPNTTPQPQETVNPVAPVAQDTTDRTSEQFEKLVTNNKSLAEENRQLKSIVESLRPDNIASLPPQPYPVNQYNNPNKPQIDDVASNLISEDGTVDVALLNKTLAEANERAKRAEEAAKLAMEGVRKYEESRLARQVHKKHPQLDPKSPEFDRDFYDAVRGEVLNQLVAEGKEDLMSAADKWAKKLFENKQKQIKIETEKVNANSLQPSPQPKRTTPQDHDDLVMATRNGSVEAINERLRRIGM